MLTKPTIHGNIIFAFGARDAFAHGEMAEWSKAPVLKTGDVKASVGSNPTLSAKALYMVLQKYPSGRRGSPAKGVGGLETRARVRLPPSAPNPENPCKSRVSVHKEVFSYERLVATSVMEAAAFSLSAVDHGLDDSAIASISFMVARSTSPTPVK